MRIEQHPQLVITHKDIDKINEATHLINEIFDEFVNLDYGDGELYELATEFEDAKDKLIDVFRKMVCGEDKYGHIINAIEFDAS